jgi:hypothetical protein
VRLQYCLKRIQITRFSSHSLLAKPRFFNRGSTSAGRWTFNFGFFIVGSIVKVANSTERSDQPAKFWAIKMWLAFFTAEGDTIRRLDHHRRTTHRAFVCYGHHLKLSHAPPRRRGCRWLHRGPSTASGLSKSDLGLAVSPTTPPLCSSHRVVLYLRLPPSITPVFPVFVTGTWWPLMTPHKTQNPATEIREVANDRWLCVRRC